MENKSIARTLRLFSQLMELYDENSFKVKAMANAAFKIDKSPYPISKKTLSEIEQIQGIGKSIGSKIFELIENDHIEELDTLIQKTPPGILDIMSIKGLGPKKVKVIWTDLNIESVGELFYACNENRLVEAKGFGFKTQEEIKKAIEFKMASSGRFLYAHIEKFANVLLDNLKNISSSPLVSFTGDFRRRCEIIDSLSFLIGINLNSGFLELIKCVDGLEFNEVSQNLIEAKSHAGLQISIQFCEPQKFAYHLVQQTGNNAHFAELAKRLGSASLSFSTESEIYKKAGLCYIEPELREGLNEFDLSESGKLPDLINFSDLKGSLHNHSTWSDGIHTLEEMALFCRNELKLEYLGICDHSKSAFYANGLSETRVIAQQEEIEILNKKLHPFKIFKGIESDILFDGSLDYPAEILSTFDFVVASIHSVFKMSEDKATGRLIKAVENPYTTILGHPTGRLLLSRNGYPIDYKKVIDACAANGVVIEINANPLRLDLDWRWHRYAIEQGVMLSVNPDAHRKDGFYDMHYGILVARKGGVQAKDCLNAFSLNEITHIFEKKRSALSI